MIGNYKVRMIDCSGNPLKNKPVKINGFDAESDDEGFIFFNGNFGENTLCVNGLTFRH